MKSNLTKQNLEFLIFYIAILFIDSVFALFTFYRNYKSTGILTSYSKKNSTIDKLRMHITDTLYVITVFICLYFLFFKNGLTPFFVILLWLLLFKSISHLILAYNVYSYTVTGSQENKNIQNISLADTIFGHIVSLIFCIFIMFKLF